LSVSHFKERLEEWKTRAFPIIRQFAEKEKGPARVLSRAGIGTEWKGRLLGQE
jgi:hypothetical protein